MELRVSVRSLIPDGFLEEVFLDDESASEVLNTMGCELRLQLGWRWDTPYVFATIHMGCSIEARVLGIPLVSGEGPDYVFGRASDHQIDLVQATRSDIAWFSTKTDRPIKSLMRQWAQQNLRHYPRVRSNQLIKQANALAASEPDRNFHRFFAYVRPLAKLVDLGPPDAALHDRFQELGFDPSDRWYPRGRSHMIESSSRGPVALEIRVFTRTTVLFATLDPGLQAALEALLKQWWIHWSAILPDTLGWWQVSDTLEIHGRRNRSFRRPVYPRPDHATYPPSFPEDLEAEELFQRNEWRLLFGAYQSVAKKQRAERAKLARAAEYLSDRGRGEALLRVVSSRLFRETDLARVLTTDQMS
jgi:hypothetical protein